MIAPHLDVVWSGVLEREKKAPGLSNPLTTCTAKLAMRHAFKAGDLTIKWPKINGLGLALNVGQVQDSNESEVFKRVIRTYEGPYGNARLFLSRVLKETELLLVPRERLSVVPLNGRSFDFADMATAGDNRKGLITGEYTLELHHENAMARLLA